MGKKGCECPLDEQQQLTNKYYSQVIHKQWSNQKEPC